VPFDASFCPFKTSYPPDHYFFYYSGNESFPPYSDHATPAARGHRGHRKGISGAAIFEPLRESVKRNKVRVKTQLKLTGLCVDDQGEVIGVNALEVGDKPFWHLVHKALFKLQHIMRYTALYIPVVFQMIAALSERVERKQGRAIKIRATQGVVLSTGGFFANQTMVKEHAPKYLGGSPLGTMTDDGCGITMAMGLGAKTGLMNSVSAWRFVNPPQGLARGVMVGPSGERVCNEMYYGAQVGEQIMANHNGKAWVIIDAQTRRQAFKDLSLKKGLWFHVLLGYFYLLLESKKANSIVELGRKIGADVENLNKTVAAYNALAASDDADPMGKPKEFVNAIENGPFYAIDISYDSSFVACPSLSLGGLVVEESSGLVKREDGSVIKGLYAAGRTAVGIPSRGYVSGLSIADCVFSGRRASRHAAQLKQELKVATSTT
jgi:3-oxo-5alpha-steroid 4-dehydrogenase